MAGPPEKPVAHNRFPSRSALIWLLTLPALLVAAGTLYADDWPEWRGKGRQGVWTETGIVDKFPEDGLTATWRTPVGAGYAGAAVVDGRVFITDIVARKGRRGTERALCLDEASGEVVWKHECCDCAVDRRTTVSQCINSDL